MIACTKCWQPWSYKHRASVSLTLAPQCPAPIEIKALGLPKQTFTINHIVNINYLVCPTHQAHKDTLIRHDNPRTQVTFQELSKGPPEEFRQIQASAIQNSSVNLWLQSVYIFDILCVVFFVLYNVLVIFVVYKNDL